MIYALYFTFLAAQGKLPELRQTLEERARLYQAEGIRAGVLVPVASLHGQAVYTQLAFDSLADFAAFRENPPAERVQATQAMTNKLAGLLREVNTTDLYEVVLPAQQMDWTAKYIARVKLTPAPGKQAALRDKGLEIARSGQARGLRAGYQVQVAGSQAGTCMQLNLYKDLDQWEERRADGRQNLEFQKSLEEMGVLLAGSPSIELLEIAVPLPPRKSATADGQARVPVTA
jgi:hypothetical protein